MWENESLERARLAFAGQFEEDAATILYRRRGGGAPVSVSAWERDALIYAFERHMRWLYAGLVVLVIGVMLAAWATATFAHLRPTLPVVILIVAPIGLAYVLVQRWIWSAPDRLIARRGAIEPSPPSP